MVGSFCSINDKNCFQPIDFEKKLLLVRRKKSRAYLLGNRLFLIAISRSSRVTWPSPSLSNSSKNRFPAAAAAAYINYNYHPMIQLTHKSNIFISTVPVYYL